MAVGAIVALILPAGQPRLRRFAGSTCSATAAFRGKAPDLATPIRAVTKSGADELQVDGIARSEVSLLSGTHRSP